VYVVAGVQHVLAMPITHGKSGTHYPTAMMIIKNYKCTCTCL